MKKLICLLLALCMLFALAACGEKKEEPEQAAAEWTREGYYMDEVAWLGRQWRVQLRRWLLCKGYQA